MPMTNDRNVSIFSEEYRSLSRKQGAMAQKIAKTAQEGGMRKTADYIHQTGGIRNAFRRKLGLTPKARPERSNPENVKKQKKATLRAARMAAVLDKHKPGDEQTKERTNKRVGALKHTKNNISPFDRIKTRKEQLIFGLIDELIENAELAKINREIRQRMSQGKPITDLAARAKELQQSANEKAKEGATVKAGEKLLDKLQGKNTTSKKKTPGYGDAPTNSSSRGRDRDPSHKGLGGSVANHPSSGGENPGTNVGKAHNTPNKHPHRGQGRSGQYGINAGYELIGDLIEANPPKPNALQTINKKHEKRTHGMTARSSYGKDGNIKIGDVFLPPSSRGKGRGGSYVDGVTKFADKTGKSVSLKQAPEKGQEDRLNNFYSKRGFEPDNTKPERYVRKPKTTNEEIISRFHDRINERYVAGQPLSKLDQQRVKNIGRAGRGDLSWVGTKEDTGTRSKSKTVNKPTTKTPEPTVRRSRIRLSDIKIADDSNRGNRRR